MSQQKYAEYTAEDIQIKKDGHVMLSVDVAKELNRKSFLEQKNQEMTQNLENLLNKYVEEKFALQRDNTESDLELKAYLEDGADELGLELAETTKNMITDNINRIALIDVFIGELEALKSILIK